MSSNAKPDEMKPEANEQEHAITGEMIATAEKLAGMTFTQPERELMLDAVNKHSQAQEKLRSVPLPNSVPPALSFGLQKPELVSSVAVGSSDDFGRRYAGMEPPTNLEEVAFAPIPYLAHLLRTRQVSSLDLTKMYLARLKRYDQALQCVVTLTEELALSQAEKADREIAVGHYRGPLHGIPWGAKDLLMTRGYPTTWGAMPYKDQHFDADATVVERLAEAGAVLVAKLSLGALAWGDVWFGGKTKNPWDLEEGSSGSSAGSAAAVAAGLVGFAIGTETYGSIVSPCTQCGVTGLRPTFGRVSRNGAMALSWSMDKIGPICRTVEDCAIVFEAIHGADGKDETAVSFPFAWEPDVELAGLRFGYVEDAFKAERDNKKFDDATLEVLRSMGANLVPVKLPDYPVGDLGFIIRVEAAAAFDELTRSDRDDLMVRQEADAWPNVFRQARLIPAVDYVQANRIRTLILREMNELFAKVDLYVAPSFEGNNLLLTNLTGHPAVVLPNGFSDAGKPISSITFTGGPFDEALILAVAKAYQDHTDFHVKRPLMEYAIL